LTSYPTEEFVEALADHVADHYMHAIRLLWASGTPVEGADLSRTVYPSRAEKESAASKAELGLLDEEEFRQRLSLG
jgi:hypothetical protein